MNNFTTIILAFFAGIYLYTGVYHLFSGLGRLRDPKHICFGCMCLVALVYTFIQMSLYGVSSVAEYIVTVRWQLLPQTCFIFLTLLAAFYTHFKALRFLQVFTGLLIVVGISILVVPASFMFLEIQGLKTIKLPWGEIVSFVREPTILCLSS